MISEMRPTARAYQRDGEVAELRVERCQVFDLLQKPIPHPGCVTIMFAPDDSTEVVAIMQKFATATGLVYGVDVVGKATAVDVGRQIAAQPGSVGMCGCCLLCIYMPAIDRSTCIE